VHFRVTTITIGMAFCKRILSGKDIRPGPILKELIELSHKKKAQFV